MQQLDLVILAAGLGSRYGGIKQLEPVGPQGETLIDYALADAAAVGFTRAVFIIRREIAADFGQLAKHWQQNFPLEIDYCYQQLEDLPFGFAVPATRKKPWGTAHALLCAREQVFSPFAVINADDYYGATSYQVMVSYLSTLSHDQNQYALLGFALKNTLSPYGPVSRGVCQVDRHGWLRQISEHSKIHCQEGRIYSNGQVCPELNASTPVSMNFWGFTPAVFPWLDKHFSDFLREQQESLDRAECYIPTAIDAAIRSGACSVRILPSEAQWLGITYRQDLHWVQKLLTTIRQTDICGQ